MKGKLGFLLKLAAAALLGVAAAALLMPLVVSFILPPERLRELIVSEARKSLHRDVRLGGINYALFQGFTLNDVAVSENPDFTAGTFASAQSIHAKVRWSALLRRRLVVDTVSGQSVKVTIIAEPSGGYNFSDIAASSSEAVSETAESPEPQTSAKPFSVRIRDARVESGEFIYKDAVSGEQWRLWQIDAAFGRTLPTGPFDARLSFKGTSRTGGRPVPVALSYSGKIDLRGSNPHAKSLTVEKLAVDYGGLRLTASGKVKDLAAGAMDLSFVITSHGLRLVAGDFTGAARALASAGGWGLSGDVKAKTFGFPGAALSAYGFPARFAVPPLSVSGNFDYNGDDLALKAVRLSGAVGNAVISGVVGKVGSDAVEPRLDVKAALDLPSFTAGLPFPAGKWEAEGRVGLDEIKIRRLRLASGRNDLEVDGGAFRGLRSKMPILNLPLKARSFDLGELAQFSDRARQFGLTGTGAGSVAISGPWSNPVLAGRMHFQGAGASAEGLVLQDFTGTISFDPQRIAIPDLTGRFGEGHLKLSLTVDNYSTAPVVGLQADLDVFDLGKYLAAKAAVVSTMSPPKPASAQETPIAARGTLAVGRLLHPNAQAKDVSMAWDLGGITSDMRRLTGTAAFKVAGGGSFSDLGGASKQSKILKVLFFPFMIFQKLGAISGIHLFPDMKHVAFTELVGDYLFSDGLMTLRDTHLNSSAGKVSALGQIDLPKETLGLVVTAHIARVAPVEVEVKGTFDKPVTHVNVGKLLISPATELLKLITP